MLGPLQLLALRENEAAMKGLCFMLELEVVEGEDLKMQVLLSLVFLLILILMLIKTNMSHDGYTGRFQMIAALQSTSSGRRYYADLCERQIALRELVGFLISLSYSSCL